MWYNGCERWNDHLPTKGQDMERLTKADWKLINRALSRWESDDVSDDAYEEGVTEAEFATKIMQTRAKVYERVVAR